MSGELENNNQQTFRRSLSGIKVISSRGFSVSPEDRHHIKYEMGEQTAKIFVEYAAVGSLVWVWLRSVSHWDTPKGSVPMTQDEKEMLRGNLKAAYEFEGFEAVFDPD